MHLFKLFYIEDDVERLQEDIEEKQEDLEKIEKKKEKMDTELRDKKRELGNLNRDLAARESGQREKVSAIWFQSTSENQKNSFINMHIFCVQGARAKCKTTRIHQSKRECGSHKKEVGFGEKVSGSGNESKGST